MEMEVKCKMDEPILPKLPLADWVESFVDILKAYFSIIFKSVSVSVEAITEGLVSLLSLGPPIILILIITALAFWLVNIRLAIFSFIGLSRSEERRVGKECRCQWASEPEQRGRL